ncbi:MAG: hypothetical protein IJY86_06060 [Clostridia bacterium]|nr:hypothetical protein [Clostridia bacterium]
MKIKYYLMIIGLCTMLLLSACGSPEEPEQTQPLITTGTTEITTDTETTLPPETDESQTSSSEITSEEDTTLESNDMDSEPMSNTELLESILATSPDITVTIFEDGVAHVTEPLPSEEFYEVISELARFTDDNADSSERPEGAEYISFEFDNSPIRLTFYNGLSCVCEVSDGDRKSSIYELLTNPPADAWEFILRNVHTAEAHRDVVFTCDNTEELSAVFGDVFAARWQGLAPSNYQRTEDYVVLECTLNELSADGEYARLFLSYNVKPAFMEHFIYAGAARKLHGEWEGWINFSGNFTVIKQESGEWLVTAMYEY